MTTVRSAGLLLYRFTPRLEVWLAHMGGPFWSRKDAAAWSIPKGLYDASEDPLAAALREFEEEIGVRAMLREYADGLGIDLDTSSTRLLVNPTGRFELLGEFRQPSGKVVTAYAGEFDIRVERVVSNTFALEWPKGSGKIQDFPEIDDARWFPLGVARTKLVKGQRPLLDALRSRLEGDGRLPPVDGAPE